MRLSKTLVSNGRSTSVFWSILFLLALLASPAVGGVAGSRHDLSSPWGDSNQPCVFCHTPHSANTTIAIQAPLWNRFLDATQAFQLYASSTLDTSPGSPNTTRSLLCLGCHDGSLGTAVVHGYVGSTKHDLINAPGSGGIPDTSSYPNCERCHPDMYGGPPANWLGTDLSNDHPVAMLYPTIVQDPAFNTPPSLSNGWTDVPLFEGRVECASCHNPHDPTNPAFLRVANAASALCLRCHQK